MSKFTPGPWRLLPPAFPHAPYTIQTTGETIASVDSEANARLIAAAPEMYAILGEVINAPDFGYGLGFYFCHRVLYLLREIDGEEDNGQG